LRGILHDSHDAEDVTQQVFAKLIDVIDKYEEREMPFVGWVLRVACNLSVDSRLPGDQREVVLQSPVAGFCPPEIAEPTGRSEGSVHGLHHRRRRAPATGGLVEHGIAPTAGGRRSSGDATRQGAQTSAGAEPSFFGT
jgi:RNA polymerase sigma-70 factor, ECF subfamily